MTKLISWNVNGIRACAGKGFLDFFRQADADVFCLQETKLQAGQLELDLPGYYQYWNYAEKKGYSGTALFTRQEPLSVTYGIGIPDHDREGRVITAEFPDYYVVTCYTPNSQNELARLDYFGVRNGGATLMREEFEPDTIIAVGGGSPMDASKIMWLLYEHPEISFSDVREKFFDIRKRAFKIPPLGKKAKLVCIPTSSGTGSEVTPFAVITDHKTGYKYPITDYALTPSVAIVDPVLARTQPRKLASDAGFDALTHSFEAYVSVYANDFTDGMALHAAKLIWDNLAESVNGEPGEDKIKAQEKMHNAATMAGMAFGSAFLGMCHGMAHTIGALCHVAHGRTNSILLPYVIRYNGSIPEEPTSWPKYNKYIAPERYQEIAKNLGVNPGKTPEEGVENLAKAVEDYRDNKLGMNKSFQECGVDEDYFWSILDQIGMRAYEDQCAPANPRIPQIEDMKDIAIAAYYGVSQAEGHKLRVQRQGEAATEEASERA